MRLLSATTCLLTGTTLVISLTIPTPPQIHDLNRRIPEPALISHSEAQLISARNEEIYSYLRKRRGGGGHGGGGSGGHGDGGSDGDGEGGSASSGSKGASGSTSSSSSLPPTYGGGRYYSGGSTTAFSSGARSPLGITPFFLRSTSLLFFPGLWLYGAYVYPYPHAYALHNASAPSGQQNETLPVECLCAAYSACGCDDAGNATVVQSVVGDGVGGQGVWAVGEVNGTRTLVINGTLPNGTAVASAGVGRAGGLGEEWWVVGVVAVVVAWGL